jgi:long-subunit acyl-CoA synthetase (AMP-forming)
MDVVKSFAIVPQDFSFERDEVTSTGKLRRAVINSRYGGLLGKSLLLRTKGTADEDKHSHANR